MRVLHEFMSGCENVINLQAVMNEVRQSLGELPIVEDELRKAAGDEQMDDESATGGQQVRFYFYLTMICTSQRFVLQVQQLVTADGTYATQSAFSSGGTGAKGIAGGAGDKARASDKVCSSYFICQKSRMNLKRFL